MSTERKIGTVLAAIGLAGAIAAAAAANDTIEVRVFNDEFSVTSSGSPVDPTIKVGDTIRWVWQQGLHDTRSVQGSPEQWTSPLRNPPFTFDHTFTQIGQFWYYCSLHGFDMGNGMAGGMAGWIKVVDPLTLDGPVPGTPGEVNVLAVEGLTPGTRVAFAYGFASGQTVIGSPCEGLVANLMNPTLIGVATAGNTGVAQVSSFVPQAASGRTVYIQAFDISNCVPTQVVVHTF